MAEMRHPHIVQFLGLCFLEGSALPVLVMERLDSSLDDLLETSPGLPLALKQSLLTDVARGLLYLHTRNPPVVHRDLSARNVLLTSSLVAKISDLGNARIVNLQPGQLARTLTRVPGTHVYMPPESFDQHSRYGPRLDIFSFGHLSLFTLTQVRRIECGDTRKDNSCDSYKEKYNIGASLSELHTSVTALRTCVYLCLLGPTILIERIQIFHKDRREACKAS